MTHPEISDSYDAYSAVYDIVLPRDPAEQGFWTALAPTGQLCEIGCGTGRITELLVATAEVVGVDISESMLARAQTRLGAQARFVLGDMRHLPFEDRTFDWLVVPRGALTHLLTRSEQLDALSEFWRVLRPGGAAVVDIPQLMSATDALATDVPLAPRYAVETNRGRYEVSVGTHFDDHAEVVTYRYVVTVPSAGGVAHDVSFELATSVLSAEDLLDMAGEVGLAMKSCFGGYANDPILTSSPRVLAVFERVNSRHLPIDSEGKTA